VGAARGREGGEGGEEVGSELRFRDVFGGLVGLDVVNGQINLRILKMG